LTCLNDIVDHILLLLGVERAAHRVLT